MPFLVLLALELLATVGAVILADVEVVVLHMATQQVGIRQRHQTQLALTSLGREVNVVLNPLTVDSPHKDLIKLQDWKKK